MVRSVTKLLYPAIIALGFCILPGLANADASLPPAVVTCVADLNQAFASTTGAMSVQVYTDRYRHCYLDNQAGELLSANMQTEVAVSPVADCLLNINAQTSAAYASSAAECYRTNSFGGIWDTPALREALINQMNDYHDLTPEQGTQLYACVASLHFDVGVPSSTVQRSLASCFSAVGLQGLATLNVDTAVVIDCARDTSGINGVGDLTHPSVKQEAYLEKCVSAKLAPAALGIGALAVPLGAGMNNIFLYLQFLITQPALLFAKRKLVRGKVFNSYTKTPLDLSTVRLFTADNKLQKTIVTGMSGDYLFVPVPGTYRLEVVKPGYVFPSQLKDGANYRGGAIAIQHTDEVINSQVPLDPTVEQLSVGSFVAKRFKQRLATVVACLAPLMSLLALIITFRWWTIVLFILQLAFLFLFFRLSHRVKPFGVVKDAKGRTLAGVVVSLFDPRYDKLVYYYVTDIFGRYALPEATGSFMLSFTKTGYAKYQENITLGDASTKAPIVVLQSISTV